MIHGIIQSQQIFLTFKYFWKSLSLCFRLPRNLHKSLLIFNFFRFICISIIVKLLFFLNRKQIFPMTFTLYHIPFFPSISNVINRFLFINCLNLCLFLCFHHMEWNTLVQNISFVNSRKAPVLPKQARQPWTRAFGLLNKS